VEEVRTKMVGYSPSQVFNSDQTGLVREDHSKRSLANQGTKLVFRLCQSSNATTRSITVLPMLFLDGTLGPFSYVLVGETTGQFPRFRPLPNTPNLIVRAAKSHMMTRAHMEDWIRTCVAHPNAPSRYLMILDSWPSFRNHDAIRAALPPGMDVEVMNLPPGTTGQRQPLDLHFNGPFKAMVRLFSLYHRSNHVVTVTHNY
jgi:hypothetical protein